MKQLLQALNSEQRVAVETTEGPVLVLAGAGSGKTRVITYRIAHLLQRSVAPEAILAMTFTNKAAAEMRKRIAALVGAKRARLLTVGTFHAFCLQALRDCKEVLGWPKGFSICDASDQLAMIKSTLRELHVGEATIQPPALQARISLLKNQLRRPEEFLDKATSSRDELIGRAWQRYQEALKRSRKLDFDDLLLETERLLREFPKIRKQFSERYRYLLVDEYQDTNVPQYEILRHLAGRHKNLCVVGDDDQSIYGWRGADVSKILNFERDFRGAKVVLLETNYRSTRDILTLANRLIEHNPTRHAKTLRAHQAGGEPVQAICMLDEGDEAEHIVREITERVAAKKSGYSDYAILFRAALQARTFEAELRLKDVPYILVGGMSFFDRKEVRDVLAYLRLVANPADEASLLRIVNCPPRGVGKTTIDRALAFATEHGIGVSEAFQRATEIDKINLTAVEVVQRLRARLQAIGKPDLELVPLIERLLDEVSYHAEVQRVYPDPNEAKKRWQAVCEILNFAENYSRRKRRGRATLAGFLNELSLNANDSPDAEDASQRGAVTLMTMHAAKGLEYPRVYIVGLEEGLLPHTRSIEEDTIEEERRLTYVAITRAQQSLTLTYCAERARYGQRAKAHPSRFLFEIKGSPPPTDWQAAGANKQGRGKKKKRKMRRRRRTVP